MGKAIKRIFIGLGILLLLLIGAAVVLPIIYKDKIVEYVKKEANKRVNADLDFDNDISLSLFKSFPDFSIGVNHVKVINKAPFAGDTLAMINSLNATLDIMSVIQGDKIKVKTVVLNQPYLHFHVLKDGRANWDVALASDEELQQKGEDTTSNFRMGLQHYEINDGKLVYNDESLGFYTRLDSFDHKGNGDFTADVFDLSTKTDIQKLTVAYGGINYLDEVKADMDADLNMNMKDMKFTFKQNKLHLNALELGFDGYVAMPTDDIVMDMTYSAKQTDFKNILSLIPSIYKNDFNQLKASGKFALNGDVKGVYNDNTFPGFKVNLAIDNGMFQYPDLPSAVTDVNIDTHVESAGGSSLDNTVINVSKAHFNMGGNPFDAHMVVRTPISDPYLDGAIKGKINLGEVQKFMKLDPGTQLSGLLDADLAMKGNLSTLEKEQYDQFNAQGYVAGQGIHYASKDLAQPVDISTTRLDFTPRYVKLSPTPVKMGSSDITAQGNLSNFLGYMFNKGMLKGDLTVNSTYFDVNPWMASDGSKPADTAASQPMEAIDLPANIDFTLHSNMQRVTYDNLDIRNFNGNIHLHDKKLDFENVGMALLGGTFNLNGYYSSENPSEPATNMNLALTSIQIPEMFRAFTSVQQFVPIAKFMSGDMDAKISLDTRLGKDMMPLWNTLSSNGVLIIERAVLANFTPLNKVADALNMQNLKSVVLTGIRPSYQIQDGRFSLKEPVKFNVGQANFSVTGSNGLDKTLDYIMQVQLPASQVQSQANATIAQVFKNNNLQIPGNGMVKLNVHIGGTMTDPQIKVDLKDLVQNTLTNLKDQAKDAVKAEVDKKVEEAKAKAKVEAQRILDQAKQQADLVRSQAQNLASQTKQQGYAQAQKLEESATNPIAKVAAKKAADKLRQETDKKAQDIINEGNRKADDILKKAQDQVNRL